MNFKFADGLITTSMEVKDIEVGFFIPLPWDLRGRDYNFYAKMVQQINYPELQGLLKPVPKFPSKGGLVDYGIVVSALNPYSFQVVTIHNERCYLITMQAITNVWAEDEFDPCGGL